MLLFFDLQYQPTVTEQPNFLTAKSTRSRRRLQHLRSEPTGRLWKLK